MAIQNRKTLKWIWVVLAIGMPVFLEVFLRLIHYGNDYPLFVDDFLNPKYLRINDKISKRYFTIEQGPLGLLNETFLKKKEENTLRIFVQGSSSTVGFPYMRGASFPRVLKARLMKAFPDKNIEVINTGITAVNSYTLLDLSDEIIAQKPDAVIIYPEHNEFYGALGIGSYQKFGDASWIVRLYLKARKIKVVQLINDFKMWLSTRDIKDQLMQKGTLMERMAREQKIPLNSPIYKSGVHQLESNLEILLKKYEKNNIPVFIGSVVCKIKDLPPFSSESSPTDSIRLNTLRNNARLANEQGRTEEAIGLCRQAIMLDSTNAELHYDLALELLKAGKKPESKIEFYKAKDFDLLRFRSPEEFNTIIKKLSGKYNAHFVDLKKLFDEESIDGVPGNDLLTEHVHPNMKGYYLIANSFYKAIKSSQIKKDWNIAVNDTIGYSDLASTELDSIQGDLQVIKMKSFWPYKTNALGTDPVISTFKPASYIDSMAFQLYQQKIFWLNAQQNMLNYYMQNSNYLQAMKTAKALKFEFTSTEIGYIVTSKIYAALHNPVAERNELLQAFNIQPSANLASEIARISLDLNDFLASEKFLALSLRGKSADQKRAEILKNVRIVNKLSQELKVQPKDAKAWIEMGTAFLNLGKFSFGEKAIANAISINPKDPAVVEFMRKYGDKLHIVKTGNK